MITPSPEIQGLATLAATGLAAVLAVAAVGKIRRPATDDFASLGLPAPRFLAAAVPPVELTIAAALVVTPRYGAVAAIPLLVAFTVVIAVALRSGRTVSCGCLGAVSTQPLSVTALVRNAGLITMALTATTIDRLVRPDLASLGTFLGFVLILSLLGQLLALWQVTGRLWSVQLAGEPRRRSSLRRVS